MKTDAATRKIEVDAFRAPEGCVAYLVSDPETREALILDPRLDQVDLLIAAAEKRGLELRRVLDTHTHADHLSGVRLLAERTSAEALRPEGGQEIELGASRLRVIPTPGHTQDSVSLYVDGNLFTGDALFVGGAGRTDFPGGSSSELFDSFRRYEELPEETVVHPGHDYDHKTRSTLAVEKTDNPLLAEKDRDALAKRMEIKGPAPANMASILKVNQEGPDPETIEPVELDNLLRLSGAIQVIDVRNPGEFASERIKGSKNIPLGELTLRTRELDRDRPLAALCRSGARSTDALRQLKAAGFKVRGLNGGLAAWQSAGFGIEGSRRLTVERQTQLVIGSMILTGLGLGFFLHPGFLAISAFFGAGLVFAGATGTCGLGVLLSKLPWNRPRKAASACVVGGSRES